MTGQPGPPAGWYPVGDSERFWDGIAWTEHVRAPRPAAPVPPPSVDIHGLSHQSQPSVQHWPPPTQRPVAGVVPGPYGYGYGYGYIAPKNPGLSLLASFFLPGLGSIINGDVARGIGIMIGYFVSWVLIVVLIGFVGLFGFWVWGLVDAYQGARLWNARHGIVS